MHFSSRLISLLLAVTSVAATPRPPFTPFLQQINPNSPIGWIIGNELWNITIGEIYGKPLFYKDQDLIGIAVGHYQGYGMWCTSSLNLDQDLAAYSITDGEVNFQWHSASVYEQNKKYLDVVFNATEIDLHWVIFPGLAGAYQYIVNKALPNLAVLRTLYRLDNTTFTRGRTNIKDAILPPFSLYGNATNVEDETWQLANGTYITKYDFSATVREIDYYGIYGDNFGSWYIRPGGDYINGNHLKQELMVHRESATGDAVQLNVFHGSHYQVTSSATFPVGKTWGPWLWYLVSKGVTWAFRGFTDNLD